MTTHPLSNAFHLGQTVITRNALGLYPEDVYAALRRHAAGDWGEVCPEDWAANDLSLKQGLRLVSAYRDRNGSRFVVVTEADRSSTCILLPEDY